MLVLSRKRAESIRIGTDIHVTVIRIGPNYVKLGITAPRDVPVDRDELPRRVFDFSREERLAITLRNLCDDYASGALDSDAYVDARDLLDEMGVTDAEV